MPLNRLSRRSTHKGALKQKTKQGQSASNNTSNRHDSLWTAIRKTRESIDDWKTSSEHVSSLFDQWILPRERRITECTCELSESLIVELGRPNRSPAERSLIGLWIIQNLESLSQHPFAEDLHWQNVLAKFNEKLNSSDPIDVQLIRLCQQNIYKHNDPIESDEPQTKNATVERDRNDPDYASSNQQTPDRSSYIEEDEEDITFDFGWHKKESQPSNNINAQSQNEKKSRQYDSAQANSKPRKDESESLDEEINSLEQRLSVDKLFRQLAKVLHPDREQDESRKEAKHRLMSECLEARQSGDIDTMLQLYCAYVGELPDELTDDSHGELIAALEKQLAQLQLEFRQLRLGNPLMNQIIDRYSDSSKKGTEKRVKEHASILDKEIEKIQVSKNDLETTAGMDAALLTRRAIELDRLSINEMTGI